MTEKQAATTQALTQAQATTVISSLEGLSSSLWSVIAQVDRISEDTRLEKPRKKLLEKGQRIDTNLDTDLRNHSFIST